MDNLILDKAAQIRLKTWLDNPPHAILLSGPVGSGLFSTAKAWARKVSLQAVFVITPDEKGTIGIEAVRALYGATRGVQQDKQIIIIDDAEAMSHEAQNALLKLLEEPIKNHVFVLTTHQPQNLLPTIHSRLQSLELKPVPSKQTADLLLAIDARLAQQINFIANGLPAEINRLINDEVYLQTKLSLAEKAKTFLSSNRSKRLLFINELASDRQAALAFIDLLKKMLRSQLGKTTQPQLLDYLDKLLDAAQQLKQNGHPRAQLLRLAEL